MFGKDPKFKRMTVQYFEPNKQKISKKYFESLHIGSKKLLDFFLLYLYNVNCNRKDMTMTENKCLQKVSSTNTFLKI